ncbi:MAG: hypothetical protein HDT28_05270 [Clostridiales bacterium]|nr:hypothetical protein [Clostridiales bacterium]
MTKDIDKLLDDIYVPDMEYDSKYDVTRTKVKSKKKTTQAQTTTLAEVPEVELPKTKAEVYAEAKGRLTQETSAASKSSSDKRRKRTKVKTVELEIAAITRDIDGTENDQPRSLVASPVWVGTQKELIPFAWRMPLNPDIDRPSKVYKQAVREARELMLPTHRNN